MACSMCGIDIPDGQSVCSMCYGDPFFGADGYYLAELEREQRSMEVKQMEEDMENSDEDNWEDEDTNDNFDLPF